MEIASQILQVAFPASLTIFLAGAGAYLLRDTFNEVVDKRVAAIVREKATTPTT